MALTGFNPLPFYDEGIFCPVKKSSGIDCNIFSAAPLLGVLNCIMHTESLQRKHRCVSVWGNLE